MMGGRFSAVCTHSASSEARSRIALGRTWAGTRTSEKATKSWAGLSAAVANAACPSGSARGRCSRSACGILRGVANVACRSVSTLYLEEDEDDPALDAAAVDAAAILSAIRLWMHGQVY